MPRVIKHPDIRRSELLDLAFDLFLRRGYEEASLNDLIAESGLSKGAFYHYFSSKDRLLDALAQRIAQQRLAQLQTVFEASKDDPLVRLNRGLARSAELKIENAEIAGQAFGPRLSSGPKMQRSFSGLMSPGKPHSLLCLHEPLRMVLPPADSRRWIPRVLRRCCNNSCLDRTRSWLAGSMLRPPRSAERRPIACKSGSIYMVSRSPRCWGFRMRV